MRSRMMIVEDRQEWSDLFLRLLDPMDEIAVTCVARNVMEARGGIRAQVFDCALVDLGLPDGSGLDIVAELAAAQPKADIVVCTVFEDEATVLRAIRAGACGYILKQDVAADLARLVAHMRAGGAPISPRIARHILKNLAEEPKPPPDPSVRLTQREIEVLELVARGMTLRRTAETLGIAESTARSHVKNLYGKLGVHRRSAAVLVATRQGLI